VFEKQINFQEYTEGYFRKIGMETNGRKDRKKVRHIESEKDKMERRKCGKKKEKRKKKGRKKKKKER
jgi:hypothetical protein